MARLLAACPILAASDTRAAAAWYRDQLGFQVEFALDDYAIVKRDDIELHFWSCSDPKIAQNTSCYIRVDNIDALRQRFTDFPIGGGISEVQARDWGMREFYIWDPSGNLLRFGQPVASPAARPDTIESMLDASAALSPEEQQASIAYANRAIAEGRL